MKELLRLLVCDSGLDDVVKHSHGHGSLDEHHNTEGVDALVMRVSDLLFARYPDLLSRLVGEKRKVRSLSRPILRKVRGLDSERSLARECTEWREWYGEDIGIRTRIEG